MICTPDSARQSPPWDFAGACTNSLPRVQEMQVQNASGLEQMEQLYAKIEEKLALNCGNCISPCAREKCHPESVISRNPSSPPMYGCAALHFQTIASTVFDAAPSTRSSPNPNNYVHMDSDNWVVTGCTLKGVAQLICRSKTPKYRERGILREATSESPGCESARNWTAPPWQKPCTKPCATQLSCPSRGQRHEPL
jgi:hypothetical protein